MSDWIWPTAEYMKSWDKYTHPLDSYNQVAENIVRAFKNEWKATSNYGYCPSQKDEE